jgi:manganese/iron transport system ATP-binding protein/manganese/zinc/iron transport system ATP- binding protein
VSAPASNSQALLEVRELSGGYRAGIAAIEAVEFAVEAGRLVAVLGPNGGGKTTLFRALLNELPERRGTVRLGGRVAYVPQTERARLDYPVTARDVVLMGTYADLPWYRRLGATQRQRADAALRQVGLADVPESRFGALSGGQRQRVLIARALAQRAEILLLDEPLSGVDRPSAELIMRVLRGLRDRGCALLIATHDIRQAHGLDLVLCLNRSQIAFGEPAATLSRDVLQRTYGGDMIVLGDDSSAVIVQHHSH